MTLVDGYFSLKSAGMCWSTLALDGHTGILQNFKNIELTHALIYKELRKILPLGLIVLVFPAWGHLHHDYKQLLDEVFVISRIIKVEVGVISLSRRLRHITLTETLIILDITNTKSNTGNCVIIH